MKRYFADKVALVTGAAMGMGFATARAFAEEGARVVLSDISQSALDDAVQTLKQEGHDATGILCDVSREDQVASLIEQTVATYGRLDAAFNNAGVQSLAAETADATSE